MTRSEALGLVRWVRVKGATVTGRCLAGDFAAALKALPCGPGEAVTSAASYAVGFPRAVVAALAAPPKALTDEQAETRRKNVAAATAAYKKRQREQKAAHDRKPGRRAAKTAWQRQAREKQKHRETFMQASMQARIANGIVRRRAKRLAVGGESL